MSDSLLVQNAELLQQGIRLLRALPSGAYAAEPTRGSQAPAIGPHFRHCLDFYLCFLNGLERRVIDYDGRQRRPEVECDRECAITELATAVERLVRVEPGALPERVRLRREASSDADGAGLLESTIGRELQFLASHTIHHYALIALALRLDGHPVPSDFGVAPSTLEHWRHEGRVAR